MVLLDELPQTVISVRDGLQWACSSGAVVVSVFTRHYFPEINFWTSHSLGFSGFHIGIATGLLQVRHSGSHAPEETEVFIEAALFRCFIPP